MASSLLTINNADNTENIARFIPDGAVGLYHDNVKKFETLSIGATVYGTMFATNFSGSGADLTDINDSTLFDSNNVARVQAVNSGVIITGITTCSEGLEVKSGTNKSQLNADGGLELARSADNLGPYIDFSLSPSTDRDARIQMEASGGGTGPNDGDLMFFVPTTGNLGSVTPTEKFRVRRGGALVQGALEVTGDITALTASDRRLKDNISPITKALEKVNSISGNTFRWNDSMTNYHLHRKGNAVGVIAQEIEALGLPELVTTRSDGYKAVKYEKLVPLLIEAVKELSAKVDTLENQINN